MAVKTYYVAAGQDGNFGALVDGTAQAAASRTDGWTVAKLAAAQMAEFDAATKQASGAFSSATKPASFLTGATANAFKTPAALTGDFANTSWVFTWAVRAGTASSQAGRMRMRVFRSVNADGSAATEITGSTQVGTTSAALTTTADGTTTVTWSPGAIVTLANEFLFFVIAWEITTAAGSNSADVVIRTGSTGPAGSRLVTPDLAIPSPISIGKKAVATTVRGITVSATGAVPVLVGDIAPKNVAKNPSFEEDISGWGFYGGATLSRDTSTAWNGTASLKCNPTAGNGAQIYTGGSAGFVLPTGAWVCSAYVKGTAGKTYNVVNGSSFVATGGWDRVSSPRTGDGVSTLYFGILAPDTDPFWIDGVQIEAGSTLTAWVDDRTTVVRGILVAGPPQTLPIGKKISATVVRGITLVPGPVSFAIGKRISTTVVRGVNVFESSVAFPIGRVLPLGSYGSGGYGNDPYGGQTVYGITLGAAYSITVGIRAAATTVRGITFRSQRTDITLPAILTMGASMSSKKLAPRSIDASLVISPALLKRVPQKVPATLTLTPVVNRKLAKALPVGLTLTPTQATAFPRRSQAISAILSLTPTVLVGRVKFQPLAGSLTLTPTLALLSGKYRTLAASPVLIPAMARFVQAKRVYNVGLSLTPTLVDMLKKPFAVGLPLPPTMVKTKANFTTLSAPLSLSAVLTKVKAAPRAISGSLALTATLARRVWAPRSFSIGLNLNPGMLNRAKMFRQLDTGLNFIPTMKKTRGFVFNVALNFEALLFKGNQFIPINLASTFRFVVEMFPRRRSIGDYLLGSVLGTANLLNAKFTSVRLLAASMGRSSLSSSVAENDDGELVSASLGKSTLESVDK